MGLHDSAEVYHTTIHMSPTRSRVRRTREATITKWLMVTSGDQRRCICCKTVTNSQSFFHRVFIISRACLSPRYLRPYKRVSHTLRMKISEQTSAFGERLHVLPEPFFRFPDWPSRSGWNSEDHTKLDEPALFPRP